MQLPQDFKDFLKLLNSAGVDYLLVGGYAVGFHGYPRATADMDIWIAVAPKTAKRVAEALHKFGFDQSDIRTEIFLEPGKVMRLGLPPVRIEILTGIDGVEFSDCFARRVAADADGIPVNVICLDDLKRNKKASGRHKDLDDLEHLP